MTMIKNQLTKILKTEPSVLRKNWFHWLECSWPVWWPQRFIPLEKLLVNMLA